MSYILDALKSSDEDRRKGRVPNLQSQPERMVASAPAAGSGSRTRFLLWLLPLVAAGLLAGVMIGPMVLRSGGEPPASSVADPVVSPPAQATPTLAADGPEPAPAPASDGLNLDELRNVQLDVAPLTDDDSIVVSPASRESAVSQATGVEALPDAGAGVQQSSRSEPGRSPELPVADSAPAAVAAAAPEVTEPVETAQSASDGQAATAAAQSGSAADPYAGLPHQRQLDYELQREIPDMNISVHVYSAKPSSRLVRIDDTIYREGDLISNDLKLEEITVNGVIMSIGDTRFWRHVR